ncbi:STAS domain-containing protein [Caldimonas tepidiphila]|uniref:STAS domain-containing protein n=1 Tax=Caldimonas tepidiphila TaxID=2315841 RepID=UPI000E5B883C|nr:STAS domain-containing protein [Caldimonas tepidiphila]
MPNQALNQLGELLATQQDRILSEWLRDQNALMSRRGALSQSQNRQESEEFFTALRSALQRAHGDDLATPEWDEVRHVMAALSSTRARQGFTPSETATFVFSLKQAVFGALREALAGDAALLAERTWLVSTLLDRIGLHTIEVFQQSREEVIARQQQELLELSTPVVQLWENVIALPLIGTLDSARTQVVMENLLQKIVETGSSIAIIDITGVPTVDTLVAQHLLKTVAAARLMGADCIISGIRPQIAQTIVHLGVDLSEVTTKATLADAFIVALKRSGSSLELNAARKAA